MSGNSKFYVFIPFFLLLAAAFIFAACVGDGGGDYEESAETASVSISVSDGGGAQAASFQPLGTGNFGDIASITVEVYDGVLSAYDPDAHTVTGTLNTSTSLTFTAGTPDTWTGQITGLPVGTLLTFVGRADNSSSVEIFTGRTEASMAAGNQNVTITMGAHSITITPPSITGIDVPADVEIGKTAAISATVVDKRPGINLPIEFGFGVVTSGDGSWAHDGILIDADGDGLFDILPETDTNISTVTADYTAPTGTGSKVQNLRVDVALSDPDPVAAVNQQFTIAVVDATGTGDLLTQFSPTVDSITATRMAGSSNVTFEAVATDDGTITSYTWAHTGGGGPVFTIDTGNPATLNSYDPAAGGNISVTVVDDASLSTTVTFPMPVFPDDVIVTVFNFDSGTTQGWSTGGLWHVTDRSGRVLSGTKSMWFGDEGTGDVGAGTTGSLTLNNVVMGGTPTLKFDYQHDILACSSTCPTLTVTVTDTLGVVSDVVQVVTPSASTLEETVDLSTMAGETVNIEIAYDLQGGSGYTGAIVDNIRVEN